MGPERAFVPQAKRGGNTRPVEPQKGRWRADVRARHEVPVAGLAQGSTRITVYDYFNLGDQDGTLLRIHHALFVLCREKAGRETCMILG